MESNEAVLGSIDRQVKCVFVLHAYDVKWSDYEEKFGIYDLMMETAQNLMCVCCCIFLLV